MSIRLRIVCCAKVVVLRKCEHKLTIRWWEKLHGETMASLPSPR